MLKWRERQRARPGFEGIHFLWAFREDRTYSTPFGLCDKLINHCTTVGVILSAFVSQRIWKWVSNWQWLIAVVLMKIHVGKKGCVFFHVFLLQSKNIFLFLFKLIFSLLNPFYPIILSLISARFLLAVIFIKSVYSKYSFITISPHKAFFFFFFFFLPRITAVVWGLLSSLRKSREENK